MAIETQKLKSCLMHWKLLNKLKVTKKAESYRKAAEQLVDMASSYTYSTIQNDKAHIYWQKMEQPLCKATRVMNYKWTK